MFCLNGLDFNQTGLDLCVCPFFGISFITACSLHNVFMQLLILHPHLLFTVTFWHITLRGK